MTTEPATRSLSRSGPAYAPPQWPCWRLALSSGRRAALVISLRLRSDRHPRNHKAPAQGGSFIVLLARTGERRRAGRPSGPGVGPPEGPDLMPAAEPPGGV